MAKPVGEVTKRSQEAARARRNARDAEWNKALDGLRATLKNHADANGEQPMPVGALFDGAAKASGASATTIQLAFDRLESLGTVHYRVGKGVFVGPAS